MTCHTCITNRGHPILHKSSGIRTPGVLFILADHCFPASLAVKGGGSCAKIIRLEYGTMDELVAKFLELFRFRPIPEGSVTLIGLPSYLERVGLTAYARDLVKANLEIKKAIPNCKMGQLPTVLLSGTSSPALVRALLDLTAWVKKISCNEDTTCMAAYVKSDKVMLELSTGKTQPPYGARHELPNSFDCPQTSTWSNGGWEGLPKAIGHLDTNRETRIITAMLRDLNLRLAM